MNRRQLMYVAAAVMALSALFFGCKLFKQPQANALVNDRYAVIVSLDGFRHLYLDAYDTPSLDAMAAEGVSAPLSPAYPSNTFPNHYSMATGLYPAHHGIVNNRFWVEEMNDYYKLGDMKRVLNPDFYLGEPIWNTAEQQGVKAGSFFWVGSETAIQNMRPSYWKSYDSSVPFTARADSVLAWLQKPEAVRPHLITWYLEEPDGAAHHYGVGSQQVADMVLTVDSVVGYFRRELAQLPIADKVDFMVVSDHGMADYDPSKVVNLWDYLPVDSFSFVVEGVPALLYAKHPQYVDEAMKVLADVPHISAYRTEDVPERFHYNDSDRPGDIVIIADLGGYVFFREHPEFTNRAGHGFDNSLPEMQGIFFGVGPSFAVGKEVSATPNVTIYPLLSRLLGLTSAPNDGLESDVDKLLGN
ncbi:MAG: ectonucleotide pyrophosphatase/phosphodiesterase [Porphyromonas sp.]|nr:ectonucleotide pyrophosphatase/phosphodiesterase [Porphyromonas sp.]